MLTYYQMSRPTIFISYCRKDIEFKNLLLGQLGVLEREGLIDIWEDELIAGGSDRFREIERGMEIARVAILIISADYLNSPAIRAKELPELLARRKAEGLRVIPLIARACAWEVVPVLSDLEARPISLKPLSQSKLVDRESILAALTREVNKLIQVPNKRFEGGATEDQSAESTYSSERVIRVAPLEANAEYFFRGDIASLEGRLLNSGRFLEKFHIARRRGLHIGIVRFIVPSVEAIAAAYKNKSESQRRYMELTVANIESEWNELKNAGYIKRVEFRTSHSLPLHVCVIKDRESVITGLYEHDASHPLGITCQRSWVHELSGGATSHNLGRCYIDWFDSLWKEAAQDEALYLQTD